MGSKSKGETRRRFKLEFTPLSLFLWGFSLFFLLAWIFALGVFVGRGFMPGAVTALTDLKGQIDRLQDMLKKDTTREIATRTPPESDPKLAFYEKLSSKREEVKRRSQTDSTVLKQTKVNMDEKYGPKISTPVESTKRDFPQFSPDVIRMPEDRIEYTLQVASLSDGAGAEDLINRLLDKGYSAYSYETKVKGRIYYRVRCGRFSTREEAERYAEKLRRDAGMKGFVTKVE